MLGPMPIMPFTMSHAIQESGVATWVRESALFFPTILATHLACIAVFGGMILMTDLRLMGLAMKDIPVATVIRSLRPWKWFGFCLMVTCGFLMAISKMDTYYSNPYFAIKLTLLVCVAIHAIIFRPLVYNNPEAIDRAPQLPGVAKLAGLTSLIIWLTLPTMGRLIAYYDAPDAIAKRSVPAQHLAPSQQGRGMARNAIRVAVIAPGAVIPAADQIKR